jgi:hypothetical protein
VTIHMRLSSVVNSQTLIKFSSLFNGRTSALTGRTGQVALEIMLCTCILEVLQSNLRRDIGFPA